MVRFLWLLLVTFAAFSAAGQAPQGYNELYEANGRVRPQYSDILPSYQKLTPAQKKKLIEQGREAFRDDNAHYPLPRILTQSEFANVAQGVDQRARAIIAFLKDHYSGRKSYVQAGIVKEADVQRWKKQHFEDGWEDLLDPNRISFMYGPDLLRSRDGSWKVIEDNPGNVGGIGDLVLAYNLTLKQYPQLRRNGSTEDPMEFYKNLVERYKEQAAAKGGQLVIYMVPPYPDNENLRIRNIFKQLGVKTITPHSSDKFHIDSRGVFTESRSEGPRTRRRVGMVMMMGELFQLDPSHPLLFKAKVLDALVDAATEDARNMLDQYMANPTDENLQAAVRWSAENLAGVTHAQDLVELREAKGLIDAYLKGQVELDLTPGADFIGDKEFYRYVPEFIKFYLNETPVLKNIETESCVTKTGRRRDRFINKVFDNFKEYVVKRTNGRGGDSVWVGLKTDRNTAIQLKKQIMAAPADYIVQKYEAMPEMAGHIVDARILSVAQSQGNVLANVAWGRGLPKEGSGKVNLSGEGREFTILVRQNSCAPYLKTSLNF